VILGHYYSQSRESLEGCLARIEVLQSRVMDWQLPEKYDNNPPEIINFYFNRLCEALRDDQLWRLSWVIGLGVLAIILWSIRHALYPMNYSIVMKVVAYGIIPSILALAGDHFAAVVIEDPKARRIYRGLFVVAALLGILLIAIVENWTDRDHRNEVVHLSDKLDSVYVQNQDILRRVTTPEQDPQTKEFVRRQAVLTLLRNEYVLTHKDIDAGLLAGTEQPPADWINQRLKDLGEKWSVALQPNLDRTIPLATREPSVSQLPRFVLTSMLTRQANAMRDAFSNWDDDDRVLFIEAVDARATHDQEKANKIAAQRATLRSRLETQMTDVLKEEEETRIEALKRIVPNQEDLDEGAVLAAAYRAKFQDYHPAAVNRYSGYLTKLAARLAKEGTD
jgi:hypothetical protein